MQKVKKYQDAQRQLNHLLEKTVANAADECESLREQLSHATQAINEMRLSHLRHRIRADFTEETIDEVVERKKRKERDEKLSEV